MNISSLPLPYDFEAKLKDKTSISSRESEKPLDFPHPILHGSCTFQTNKIACPIVKKMKKLGYKYLHGKGKPLSDEKALECYKIAALKDTEAKLIVANMFLMGIGVTQSNNQAFNYCRFAANDNDKYAQSNLGWMYEEGIGVPQSDEMAFHYYKLAADQGDAIAQRKLGYMYLKGFGVKQSNINAFKYYKKAIDQNPQDKVAQGGLKYISDFRVLPKKLSAQLKRITLKYDKTIAKNGNLEMQKYFAYWYKTGTRVSKSYEKALKYYKLAADQGDAGSQYYLAKMYEKGKGTSQSDEMAYKYYLLAANQNEELYKREALYKLGYMHENGKHVPQSYEQAFHYYQLAANNNNANARYKLGEMYEYGIGVLQSDEMAFGFYKKGAEESLDAEYKLGKMYEQGKGVPQSNKKAFKYYKKVAKYLNFCYSNPDERSALKCQFANYKVNEDLGRMYAEGKGVTQSHEKASKYFEFARAIKAIDESEDPAAHKLLKKWKRERLERLEADEKIFESDPLAIEQEDVQVQSEQGLIEEEGKRETPSKDEISFKSYLLSVAQGDSKKFKNLFQLSLSVAQKDNRHHYTKEEILKEYKLAAKGCSSNLQKLGYMYLNGLWGVKKSAGMAFRFYEVAAHNNNSSAQKKLAWMYEKGIGVTQSNEMAFKYYQLAVDQDDTYAKRKLGQMYEEGKGVPQSYSNAIKYYKLAAKEYNAEAQCKLGKMYEEGKGVPQSDEIAFKCYKIAAHQYGSIHDDGNPDEENHRDYLLACYEANNKLGWMYAKGKGVPQSDEKALKYFKRAAEKGHTEAQRHLGYLYLTGKGGVAPSRKKTLKYLLPAAEKGNEGAKYLLSLFHRPSEPSEKK